MSHEALGSCREYLFINTYSLSEADIQDYVICIFTRYLQQYKHKNLFPFFPTINEFNTRQRLTKRG